MRNIRFVVIAILIVITAFLYECKDAGAISPEESEAFSFAFMTDIHLNFGTNGCFDGFEKAINSAEQKGVDFIITGGDNCDIDVLGNDGQTAHDLYKRFASITGASNVPVYPSVGNHDRFYAVQASDPLYNEGLFEEYMGTKSYYSFEHKGWHFIILNTSNSFVDDVQKKWLQKDLAGISPGIPVVLIVHVPFISAYYPALYGYYTNKDTTKGFKQIWNMFKGYNLKLVLQGHMHIYEEIKVLNTPFVTGGAVSADWWSGPYFGTQEGYLKVNIDESNNVSWEYIDYGWSVK
jgi:Icc-related predicted phosphoesterase